MRLVFRLPVVLLLFTLVMGVCSGDELDCDLGNEITGDFDELGGDGPPTADEIQTLRDKIGEFEAPDDIDEVETVKENLDTFIDELTSDNPTSTCFDPWAKRRNEAGEKIEAFLADNC